MRISLEHASELLVSRNVVAVPTETVYGLAASVKCPDAVAEIFSLKGRPSNNPLIIHVSSIAQISYFAQELSREFFLLAEAFWPGPLTVVLPVFTGAVPEIVRAGLSTAAFRWPSHPLAQHLLERVGPLVMPSANLSGRPSSTCVEHVETDFGSYFPVLDGGQCVKGLESTILFWRDEAWSIIRLGALAPEDFRSVLGYSPKVVLGDAKSQEAPLCPGQLYRHYAPKARLILEKAWVSECSGAVIGFSDRHYPLKCRLFSLGTSSNPEKASQRLYTVLRELDQVGITEAWVDLDFPDSGLWITLKERLLKAAQRI